MMLLTDVCCCHAYFCRGSVRFTGAKMKWVVKARQVMKVEGEHVH
jgi:hypothetical protein